MNYRHHQSNFHQHQGVQHQVGHPHQNIDNPPHQINLLVIHRYSNPH